MSFEAAVLCTLAMFIATPVAIYLIWDFFATVETALYYRECAKARKK